MLCLWQLQIKTFEMLMSKQIKFNMILHTCSLWHAGGKPREHGDHGTGVLCVSGASGSGKSALLALLASQAQQVSSHNMA